MIQEQAQQGSNWEYLCSLLRTLLAVPYDSLVGRGMWRLIVSTANRVVTTSQKENVEFLSNQDILDLIGRKQLLDEKFNAIHDEDTSQDAMRQRIRQLEDELLDLKRVTRFASSTPEYTARLISDILSQVSDVMEVKFARDDPIYSKYFTLLESGARMEDVLALCRKEGNDEKVVRGPAVTLSVKPEFVKRIQADALKNAPPGTVTAAAGTSTAAGTAPVEDPNDPRKKPEYAKWFKLQQMGIPREHLVLKMEAEGVDPSILDYQPPGGMAPASGGTAAPADDPNDPRKKPEFAKWFKLQQMGIPREHLVLKMEAEGVDPSILDYGGPAATPAAPAEEVVRPRKKEEKKAEAEKPKSTRRRPKQNPEQKMKNVHWDPVDDDKIDASVWRSMHDTVEGLDYALLTTTFKAKENTFLANSVASVDLSVKKQAEMVQLVTDAKRLRNVGMAVARLKCSFESLKIDILRVDDAVLTDDMVRILKENAPTAEEIELVKGYDGSVEMLGDVDRFFKVLSTIPDLQNRIKCIAIRKTLREDLKDMQADFTAFGAAMRCCAESAKFARLMEVVLAIGNYMNGACGRWE